jgi:hypothetical protein
MNKSPFAVRREDALEWRTVPKRLAGVAERSGFRVRANSAGKVWQVWATESEYIDLQSQLFA